MLNNRYQNIWPAWKSQIIFGNSLNDPRSFESQHLSAFRVHARELQHVLNELPLGIHKRQFKPVLDELLVESNNRVGVEHARIHFEHIIRPDPTDVTQLFPSERQTYLSDPLNHLSTWKTNRAPGARGGIDEWTCSRWAAERFDGFKARLEYDGCRDNLIQNEEQDPEGCRAGSLESEPYSPDAEIPFFADMVDSFADVFGVFGFVNICFLVTFIRNDPHGVLFWSWKILYFRFAVVGGWGVAARMMLTLYRPGAFIAFFYIAFPELGDHFVEVMQRMGLD